MIRQIEEGDTKGGIIIPEDMFKEFVEVQRRWVEGGIEKVHPKRGITNLISDITPKWRDIRTVADIQKLDG